MDIFLSIMLFIWGGCVVGLLYCLFMLLRTNHVYEYRQWVLNDKRFSAKEQIRRWECLPPYSVMLWQLTKWDWAEYLPDSRRVCEPSDN